MSQSVPEPSSLVLGLVSVVFMGSLGLIRHRRHSAHAGHILENSFAVPDAALADVPTALRPASVNGHAPTSVNS
jgi:hypothetical protein